MTSPRPRALALLTLPAVLAGLLAAVPSAAGAAPAAAPGLAAAIPATTSTAAPDFASEVFADAWDFSNPEDVLLDEGPTAGLRSARVSDGNLVFALDGPGYVSPLWGGYPGALFLGRDGSAPQNRLDTSRYTRLSMSAYSSQAANAAVFWWNCPGLQDRCGGGVPFGLRPGWNTYDVVLDHGPFPTLQADWTGQVHGLRLAVTPTAGVTSVAVDWMRVYQPGQAGQLPAGTVWDVDEDAGDNTSGNPGWGTLPSGDPGALPPGRYSVREPGAPSATGPLVLRDRPRPVIVDPDAVGGLDYAAADPWDFAQTSDVVRTGNLSVQSFGDRLSAVNAGPATNDPFVYVRLPGGVVGDTTRFHRLTVRSGYEGPFNLNDVPGGGTNARVVWQPSNSSQVQQTEDVVTYSGTRSLTVDLSAPGIHETDPGTAPPQDWSAAQVTGLRWDPNEDRGARRWTLDRMALRADDEAGTHFDVRWYDTGYAPGSTVTFYRDSDQAGFDGQAISGALPQTAGTNTWRWDTSTAAPGRAFLYAVVTGPAGTGRSYSTGPVQVTRAISGQSPSPTQPLARDLGDACPQSRVPEDGYGDVQGVHEASVDCIAWWRVTQPVGGYRPADAVTRGQMATFLARVVEGTGGTLPAGRNSFGDDDGNEHEQAIDELAAAGIVGGFGDGTYGPSRPVTRAQMATFLVRTAEYRAGRALPAPAAYFTDDDGSEHEPRIDRAAAAGLTGGVLDGRYAPGALVRRDQMASFLARLLDSLVAGGSGAPPLR